MSDNDVDMGEMMDVDEGQNRCIHLRDEYSLCLQSLGMLAIEEDL